MGFQCFVHLTIVVLHFWFTLFVISNKPIQTTKSIHLLKKSARNPWTQKEKKLVWIDRKSQIKSKWKMKKKQNVWINALERKKMRWTHAYYDYDLLKVTLLNFWYFPVVSQMWSSECPNRIQKLLLSHPWFKKLGFRVESRRNFQIAKQLNGLLSLWLFFIILLSLFSRVPSILTE